MRIFRDAVAILLEGLRGLKEHGAETAIVETHSFNKSAKQLYEAVWFQVVHKVLKYGKEF